MGHSNISIFIYLFFFGRGFRLWTHNSQVFCAFYTCIKYLSLEGHFFKLININLHKFQILFTSKFILKCNFCVDSCICEFLLQDCFILWQICRVLMPKFHGLMQLYNNLHINADYLVFQNICKILGELLWVYNFHISICKFCKLTNNLHFASLAFNCHDVYCDISLFCN